MRQILVKVATADGGVVTISRGPSGTRLWADGIEAAVSGQDPAEYVLPETGTGSRATFRIEVDRGRPVLVAGDRRYTLGPSDRTAYVSAGLMWAACGLGILVGEWATQLTGLSVRSITWGFGLTWLVLGIASALLAGLRFRHEILEWPSVRRDIMIVWAFGLIAGAVFVLLDSILATRR